MFRLVSFVVIVLKRVILKRLVSYIDDVLCEYCEEDAPSRWFFDIKFSGFSGNDKAESPGNKL